MNNSTYTIAYANSHLDNLESMIIESRYTHYFFLKKNKLLLWICFIKRSFSSPEGTKASLRSMFTGEPGEGYDSALIFRVCNKTQK